MTEFTSSVCSPLLKKPFELVCTSPALEHIYHFDKYAIAPDEDSEALVVVFMLPLRQSMQTFHQEDG